MRTTLYTDGYDMECFKKACDEMDIKVIQLTKNKVEVEYKYDFNLFYLGYSVRTNENLIQIKKQIEKL